MADFTPKICHIVSLAKKQVFQRISFYRLVTWLNGENATASLSAAFTASSQRYSAMSDISRPAVERPVQTSLAPAASQQDPATASRTLAQSATDQQLPRKTPELMTSDRVHFVVLACEEGGRWGPDVFAVINDLVRLKVAPLHPLLRRSAALAYTRRWWSILAMGAQSAAIDCILARDLQV